MIVNRHTLKKFGICDYDISSLQNLVRVLPAISGYDGMSLSDSNRICSVLHFETSELITAMKEYKKRCRSDAFPKTDKLIKILEDIEK